MDLPSLAFLVATIRQQAPNQKLIVFGSGSLLATFPELGIEEGMLRRSRDADFLMFPWDEALGLAIHHVVGADFAFDRAHGYHADIVRPFATENFPPGWEGRLVSLEGMANVFCLNPHDMAVAKLFAGRPKDIELLTELAVTGRLDLERVGELLCETPMVEAMIVKTHQRLRQVAQQAAERGTQAGD